MIKKILSVDDSALMRRVLSDIIARDKRFVQEDVAVDGLEAYDLILSNTGKYDLIILDINMPKMNGIQLLEKLNEKKIKIPVLIVSTLAKAGAAETLRCLELGAVDFITKPESFIETKSEKFSNKIISYMCAALSMPVDFSGDQSLNAASVPTAAAPSSETVRPSAGSQVLNRPARESSVSGSDAESRSVSRVLDGPMSYIKVDSFKRLPHKTVGSNANKLVAIASSTGGPKALQSVIPLLPANLDAPVLLVQHMPEGFTGTLATRLDEMSKVKVKEAETGDILKKGTVYLARGGAHLRVKKTGRDYQIVLGDDPARNGLRPCADIMYESLSELDYDEVTCVVLTGMGSDGTRGIGQLSTRMNAYVIAQDEASSTVYGMPRMVKEAGITDEVVPIGSVADSIAKIVGTC